MAAVNASPNAVGQFSNNWFGEPVKIGTFKQRFTSTGAAPTSRATGALFITSSVVIPPRSRLRWLYARNASTITYAGGGAATVASVGAAPDAYAIFHSTSSAPTTTDLQTNTSGTGTSTIYIVGGIIGLVTATASNTSEYDLKWNDTLTNIAVGGSAAKLPVTNAAATNSITANMVNTSTNPSYIHVVPVNYTTVSTTESLFYAADTAGTTDYYSFGTSATSAIDVWAQFEYVDAPPSIS